MGIFPQLSPQSSRFLDLRSECLNARNDAALLVERRDRNAYFRELIHSERAIAPRSTRRRPLQGLAPFTPLKPIPKELRVDLPSIYDTGEETVRADHATLRFPRDRNSALPSEDYVEEQISGIDGEYSLRANFKPCRWRLVEYSFAKRAYADLAKILVRNGLHGPPHERRYVAHASRRPRRAHARTPSVALISRISSAMRNSFCRMSSAS